MKKTIFDLTVGERNKIEQELKNTPYGKSLYLLANGPVYIVFISIILGFILYLIEKEVIFNDMFIIFLIALLFLQILLKWKWIQLIKVYYDEKVKK